MNNFSMPYLRYYGSKLSCCSKNSNELIILIISNMVVEFGGLKILMFLKKHLCMLLKLVCDWQFLVE
ncbi:hypothetical protein BDFB_006824, partial [Asbolus verrucosus]